jgi:hypothetical protein
MDGPDVINGNAGDDTVGGGPGDDAVHGGRGRDQVNGGQGNDTVSGDRDNDTIAGGAGADRFEFDPTSGSDLVTDFDSSGGDRIALPPGLDYSVSDTRRGVEIKLGGALLRLAGVHVGTLGFWLAEPVAATPTPTPAGPRPSLSPVANPPRPPRPLLLWAIVALAVAFVGLLSVGLVQLVRGPGDRRL